MHIRSAHVAFSCHFIHVVHCKRVPYGEDFWRVLTFLLSCRLCVYSRLFVMVRWLLTCWGLGLTVSRLCLRIIYSVLAGNANNPSLLTFPQRLCVFWNMLCCSTHLILIQPLQLLMIFIFFGSAINYFSKYAW